MELSDSRNNVGQIVHHNASASAETGLSNFLSS
jgi:hypothetical protein